ncbi:microcin C transport system substrate-binding protein [Rubritalea squalenifaciens DSM 18772]|uniref:Microcin C transport system substrate-binding protein n=1 Tax=Rubritalea squalenifaciens DSM 18772 TaxID=1123071 RepID=A0A1M6M5F7_9BACT|nr:extracellular solute-binding protein [Rubritalea squalenifaciens]SHJ78669.1 microcin C transport system substrate-binding protein [Rubritalea squalenifaciens DSM 18772]
MKFFLAITLFASLVLMSTSCKKEVVVVERESRFEPFVKKYNRHISEWLKEKHKAAKETEAEIREKIAKAETPKQKAKLEKELANHMREVEKYEYRISLGDYFSFKTPGDLPEGLVWENGMDNPVIGDPAAKKGGTFNTWILDYPPSLRAFGPNSNNSFRSELYDNIEIGLVGMHPITGGFIPGVAKEWALGEDGKTVFFKLDPDATYTDGVQVKAKDFMFYLYVRLSDDVSAPFQKQYFKEQFANITVYDESTLSISLPEPKPLLPFFVNITPAPPHFYSEYGPDFAERYNWRVQPTTGAYTVDPKDIKKGRSISLTRVKDWWAKDKKFYKYSYNVDKIFYLKIAEPSKAFELFRLGKLDSYSLGDPNYWYDRMEIPEYFNGYIEKVQFYNVYPRPPWGFHLNVAEKPLDDKNIRIGLSHALNFDKVNTIIYRGDSERLKQFSEGFQEFTDPSIEPREYSVVKAEEAFSKAGYTKRDSEGFLVNDQGQRLQVEMSWSTQPLRNQMMALLKEDARKAGVNLLLDAQQPTVSYRKVMEKRHKAVYTAWAVTPPFPRYFQFFHSENAFDEKGNKVQQTNNLMMYSDPEMDRLCEAVRFAKTKDELKDAAWKVQNIVHDEALFIPALKNSYSRLAHWRWMKWPDTKYYEFCSPITAIPSESYLYWIDEELKEETLRAKKDGVKLPEKNNLFDLYRDGIPSVEILEQREVKKN